jgi:hypothetical protein
MPNWLTITLSASTIIATVIAPLLAVFIQFRISQPKSTPDPNQPKNLIQRIGGWLNHFALSGWFVSLPLLGIPLDIWQIHSELAKTTPLTRGSVFGISMLLSSIVFIALCTEITLQSQAFRKHAILTVDSITKLLAIVDKQDEAFTTRLEVLEKLKTAQTELAKPVPGLLRRVLRAIKNN